MNSEIFGKVRPRSISLQGLWPSVDRNERDKLMQNGLHRKSRTASQGERPGFRPREFSDNFGKRRGDGADRRIAQ
jgi:hypothetical protein